MDQRATIEHYYRCFRERDLEGLRGILTEDFRHVSSFGEHSDRDRMLADIWPSVGESWARDLHVFGEAPEFMVRYVVESRTRAPVGMAEYIRFRGDRIEEIEVYLGRDRPG